MKKLYLLVIFITLLTSCSSSDNDEVESPNSTLTVSDLTLSIDENPFNNSIIGQLEASTSSGDIKFSVTNQNPIASINIDRLTGEVSVRDSLIFNYETNPVITAFANVTNGEITKTVNLTININDVYEKYSHIGNITLSSQNEVNMFGAENPWGVSNVLTIYQNNITDYSPIYGIKSVGTLLLKGFSNSLPDLSFIENIEKDFIIDDNEITNLTGLTNIENLEGNLKITNNFQLENLEGFNGINIGESLIIYLNPHLLSLDGLQNVGTINEGLHITRNNNLIDISALSAFLVLNHSLIIYNNYDLNNLIGLENITEIHGRLRISANHSINNLNSLSNLQLISGELKISSNPSLNDLCGITNLISNGEITGDYIVESNLYNPTQLDIIDGNCSN